MISITPVRSAQDCADARDLAYALFDFLRARYPDRIDMIDSYLLHQDFDAQIRDIPRFFGPPAGECLLARLDGLPAGIVMLKRYDDRVAELNRMFVAKWAQRNGIGRSLCLAIMQTARELGYAEIRLDAIDGHIEALPLYRNLGFLPDPDPPAVALSDPHILSFRQPL